MRCFSRGSAVVSAAVLVVFALAGCTSTAHNPVDTYEPPQQEIVTDQTPADSGLTEAAPIDTASGAIDPATDEAPPSDISAVESVVDEPAVEEPAVDEPEQQPTVEPETEPAGGTGIPVEELDYNWAGEPVAGPSIALPDGEYRCFISNAPLDASLTWIGNLTVSGGDVALGTNPGTIEYSSTTDVFVTGAGLDSAERTVVVQEPDGTMALWIKFAEQAGRCAP